MWLTQSIWATLETTSGTYKNNTVRDCSLGFWPASNVQETPVLH